MGREMLLTSMAAGLLQLQVNTMENSAVKDYNVHGLEGGRMCPSESGSRLQLVVCVIRHNTHTHDGLNSRPTREGTRSKIKIKKKTMDMEVCVDHCVL